MFGTTALAAVLGGALATLTLLMLSMRVGPIRRALIALMRRWLRMSHTGSVAVGAAAAALALWLAWPVASMDPVLALRTRADTVTTEDASALISEALQQPAQASDDTVATNTEEKKAHALASLRAFAARVQDMRPSTEGGAAAPSPSGDGGATELPDVETMMANLRERLTQNPGDVRGWMTLGWACANTGKRAEAVQAYEEARKLDPNNSDIAQALAELKRPDTP